MREANSEGCEEIDSRGAAGHERCSDTGADRLEERSPTRERKVIEALRYNPVSRLSRLVAFRARVRLLVDVEQPAHVEVGVALRGAELRVAEQLLNRPQVGAGAEQMGREGVPQGVWTDALRNRGCARRLAHDAIDAARGQAAALEIQEERIPSARSSGC